MKSALALIPIIAFSLITTMFTATASADTSTTPQWIQNDVKWWSEGAISDADFVTGMQYLVQQGIVPVQFPISQVSATDNTPSDNDRAMSISVHFVNIENVPSTVNSEITINSFQRLVGFAQTIQNYRISSHVTNVGPQFQLVDLPSKDKTQFYQLVSSAILTTQDNNGQTAPIFDTKIDVITGDGTLLYTVEYDQCQIGTYWVYADSNKQDYRMASEDQTEYREVTNFVCDGYHLDLPSNNTGPNSYSP
ncbi:MAG: hypothetical protein ACREBB_07165 [Nitrosotalea sp.]